MTFDRPTMLYYFVVYLRKTVYSHSILFMMCFFQHKKSTMFYFGVLAGYPVGPNPDGSCNKEEQAHLKRHSPNICV